MCGHFCEQDSPNRDIYCGNAAGQVLVYGPNFKTKKDLIKTGKRRLINAMTVTKDVVIAGSSSFKIFVLSRSNMDLISEVNVYQYAKDSFNGNIKALAICEATNKLAVGLHSSEIYEISYTK